jgi:hypothetical protein
MKTSGHTPYSLGADLVTKDFDNNDLGINFQTNYYSSMESQLQDFKSDETLIFLG